MQFTLLTVVSFIAVAIATPISPLQPRQSAPALYWCLSSCQRLWHVNSHMHWIDHSDVIYVELESLDVGDIE
ncbi:hypothetical protein EYC84_009244 [Monilinia fructicola]|uniref:C2H2-type domain-containing protein n=1 Tax=Monilinia fructicola TaxID=38448 RepID=A0A5M9JFV3_MONFR|nr:hypothetical protein EYC84_009244 [Monilinia fructicola]